MKKIVLWVYRAQDYVYSSASDYADEKGLLDDIVVFHYYGLVGKERDPPQISGAQQRGLIIKKTVKQYSLLILINGIRYFYSCKYQS
ncbi:hypothetical protein [Aequorivita capsosiphonis]|uniref:hypothetical protein n=1 Tax=Aequorivita capsosiphonis TaxID=487317 RepID=UPI0004084CA0|nr:hypothetical protein [Aequorivita capsosiphonis]